jgi:3'-5' exoribonuclease
MKTFFVKDLVAGQTFDQETFVLKDITAGTDRNGRPYYDVVLADKTGEIKGKVWSDYIGQLDLKSSRKGYVVTVAGRIESYKGLNQLSVLSMRGVDETQLDDYLESSIYPADQLWAELADTVDSITQMSIKHLLQNIMNDAELGRKLKYWPAGMSIHHGFRSGLLQHILEMLTVLEGLPKYFPEVNYDIVKAGIILHDIGKLQELKAGGLVTDYERTGNLLGHMALGVIIVDHHAPKDMPEYIRVHLQHIILSHHGEKAKGSPVNPATPEAVIVQMCDELSAKTRKILDKLKAEGVDGMTKFDYWDEVKYWDGKDNLNAGA